MDEKFVRDEFVSRCDLLPLASTKSHASAKIKNHYFRISRLSNLLSARSLLSHTGASKMLRATGHARMVNFEDKIRRFFEADSESPHMT